MKRFTNYLLAFCLFAVAFFIFADAEDTLTTDLLAIGELEQKSTNGDHAGDDIKTSSLEINFRENVTLDSKKGQTRYDNAWYPRIKKVSDDLYIMFWMYGQLGRHLYVSYSNDGQTWSNPEVFWAADNSKKFTHTSGPLVGQQDQFLAANADACVLDNGDILCVYAVRPSSGYGYSDYIELNGIFMRRGTVGEDNKVTWSDEVQITKGQVWEPYVFQRNDGRIELYWSCAVGYIDIYGFDKDKRSTCVSMVYSTDNGYTWSPDTNKASNYVGLRVFQEYIGDKIPYGTDKNGNEYTEAVPYFGGQMPAVIQLYNGKSLLAAEVQKLNKRFHVSLATSKAGGEWEPLGLTEKSTDGAMFNAMNKDSASPYLARFESGEVVLAFGVNSVLRARMLSPDASVIDSFEFFPAEGVPGAWGSVETLDSHKIVAINTGENGEHRNINLFYAYLNHRIDAKNYTVTVDGYTNDWKNNTDAIFVGSDTQAQATLRVAHDTDNVYFLVSRLDNYLLTGDLVAVCVGVSDTEYYRITAALDGTMVIEYCDAGIVKNTVVGGNIAVKLLGTRNYQVDIDEGAVFEISVPKSLFGISDANRIPVCLSVTNIDSRETTVDGLTGVSVLEASRWPRVTMSDAVVVYGDCDGDGSITIRDAARILQYKADWDVEIDIEAADVDGDGNVTIRDAARILQYKAGWDVTLGDSQV